MTTTDNGATYWVCVDCYYAHNGIGEEELGEPYPREVLSRISDTAEVTAGLVAEEHAPDCPVWLGDPNRADVPVRDAECGCEEVSFSWSSCDGCGSPLGGSRHALTVWEDQS